MDTDSIQNKKVKEQVGNAVCVGIKQIQFSERNLISWYINSADNA